MRRDVLPERRIVVRFDFVNRGRKIKIWLLIERRDIEICRSDPGFGDDLIVKINDPLAFARWHLGLIEWPAAVPSGAIDVTGPSDLRRALPTWNAGPDEHARLREKLKRVPGSEPPRAVAPQGPTLRPFQRGRVDPGRHQAIAGFHGHVITPDDPDYDSARAVWNGAIDCRPRYIARCASGADVTAALRFGRDRDLPITVRGGGHGVAGTAVCDDGLVIDLGPMKSITIDPGEMTATVQAGVLWGELDAATQAFGLATTGGTMSQTGVSGLPLGGGIGWLMRRFGLAADNLLAAELITTDGENLTASEREHPDLFWGLRGGGGALGVVTSFTYRLHRVGPEVLAGAVIWALEDAPEVLHEYREFVAAAPPEVATIVGLRKAPPTPFLPVELHQRPVCIIAMLALGEPDKAERLLAPMRTFGRPLIDVVKHRPYVALQSLLDATVPPGWHYYWKSAGLRTLDDDVIGSMIDHTDRIDSPWSYTVMFHLGGAVADVEEDATAYSRRDVTHEVNINAVWLPHEPIGDAETAWARGFFSDLQPRSAGPYLNFLDRDDEARRSEAFSAAAQARLLDLQHRFDPDRVLQPSRVHALIETDRSRIEVG